MSKTQEELDTIRAEIDTIDQKLHELNEEELKKITGGEYANMPCRRIPICPGSCNAMWSGLFKCPYTINSGK